MKLLNSGLKTLLATALILGTMPAQAQVTETVSKRHMIAAANPHAMNANFFTGTTSSIVSGSAR